MRELLLNESGATMVEYSVMLALIAAVCLLLVDELGEKLISTFQSIVDGL